MSDLPSLGSTVSPFGPGGPGGPGDPSSPGAPGAPTHTQVHAHTTKYYDDLRIGLQTKTILSLFCINGPTILHGRQKEL